jgi:ATP diphosphatase
VSGPAELARLLEIMRRLRDPVAGCPWDREQNFASIAPYTIEEAYEVADAIERRDYAELRSELGDLLFQVVFHAHLAQEQKLFSFADVARSICDKLERRHPHVFADGGIVSSGEQAADWERRKAHERAARGLGILGGVPLALPALRRAEKLGRRAAGAGFDWPDARGPRAAIEQELQELDAALAMKTRPEQVFEELGDVLFSVVNLARHVGVDPEEALRASNSKFSERLRSVEESLAARGRAISDASADELDQLWRAAKNSPK